MLFSAALTASTIAPARADPAERLIQPGEPLISLASATISKSQLNNDQLTKLPKIAVPELLDPQGEPILTSSDNQAVPADAPATLAVKPTGDLGTMVSKLRGSAAGSRELECLATGIYFESNSESLAGQLAVGEVIANRAKSGRFAKTYCGVLTQRGQFSFVRGGSIPFVPRSSRQWQTAVAVAKIVAQKLKSSGAPNALFFHARHVAPRWRLKHVASIGNHIFYR